MSIGDKECLIKLQYYIIDLGTQKQLLNSVNGGMNVIFLVNII